MRIYLFVLFAYVAVCNGQLVVELDQNTASYAISVQDQEVANSNPIFITVDGKQCDTKSGCLKIQNATKETGQDILGAWSADAWIMAGAGVKIKVIFKTYDKKPNLIFFGQHFLTDIYSVGLGDKDKISTGFPRLSIQADGVDVGYLAYGGIMFGDTNKKIGIFSGDLKDLPSGIDSGPLVLFDQDGNAVVTSSFTSFMAGSTVYETVGSAPSFGLGIMGSFKSIPKDFSYWSIMCYSENGINAAMSDWGEVLRTWYGKTSYFRDSDFSINYLGYWTDNGAYYYYNTESGKNYEDTLLDVKKYSDAKKIPYRYIQYDSWFYPKGPGGGVTEWVSMDSIFPNGLYNLFNVTGWPVVAHNRWWSDKTPYAKTNKGNFNFVVEPETHKSIPTDQVFWDYLMESSKKWGLIVYEQDWLNVEFDQMNITVTDITMGQKWLRQMGQGAAKTGLTIQYCMSPSRHALQSLEIPVVTQARVSTDYHLRSDQWKIGVSSILADAIGVAPFKDTFWTTSYQPGNTRYKGFNSTEPYPALQSVVATLSTGPVGPSDKNGCTDVDLIMKSVNEDGLILKPSHPAKAIDLQIMNTAFNGFKGEIWSTYSEVSGYKFGIILAADFGPDDEIQLYPSQVFGNDWPDKAMIFRSNDSVMGVREFNMMSPVTLKGCTKKDFCLYYVMPIIMFRGDKLYIEGELTKWVPMSSKRVTNIEVASDDVLISFTGAVNEMVFFQLENNGDEVQFFCRMNDAGVATLRYSDKSCIYV